MKTISELIKNREHAELRATCLGMLLSEKYEEVVDELLRALFPEQSINFISSSEWDDDGDQQESETERVPIPTVKGDAEAKRLLSLTKEERRIPRFKTGKDTFDRVVIDKAFLDKITDRAGQIETFDYLIDGEGIKEVPCPKDSDFF